MGKAVGWTSEQPPLADPQVAKAPAEAAEAKHANVQSVFGAVRAALVQVQYEAIRRAVRCGRLPQDQAS